MNFQEAQEWFSQLERQYQAGQISEQQYRQRLHQLRVIDRQGRAWELQAHTGQWHVYVEGQWVPSPSRAPGLEPQGPSPAWAGVTPAGVTPALTLQTPPRRIWLWVLGTAGGLLACALVIVVGFFGYRALAGPNAPRTAQDLPSPGNILSPRPQPTLKPAAFTQLEVTTAAVGSSPVSDSHGTSLLVPAGAVEEGKTVQLTALEGRGGLVEQFGKDYSVDTPFYRLSMPGEDDGLGPVELSFPAASPGSRLLTVIDGQYPGFLEVVPENGRLTIQASPRPALTSPGSLTGEGEIYYAVMTPAEASLIEPAGQASPGSIRHLAAPLAAPLASYDRNRDLPQAGQTSRCSPDMYKHGCWQNADGSVQVRYFKELGVTDAQAQSVVLEAEAIMKRYYGAGFSTAAPTRWFPLYVVITDKVEVPKYTVANGVVNIRPEDAASLPGGSRYDLWHEMAHWIQDEEYNMTWAFAASAPKRWWLDASAEVMVMFLDAGYIPANLTFYGKGDLGADKTIFQGAPYVWPDEEYYVQAQLLMVNMCDNLSACPISASTFKWAINNGVYPMEASLAQELVSQNMVDYARYLLGVPPQVANTGIPLNEAVQTGAGYGDYVELKKSNQGDFDLVKTGLEPRMAVDRSRVAPAITIQTTLEKDTVYPLRVFHTPGRPGMVAVLTIEPGAPFYYRLGDGDPFYHDGSKELVLAPIHPDFGLSQVRLVAVGKTGGEVFKAKITPIDLSGVWAFQPGKILSNNVTCTADDPEDAGSFNTQALPALGTLFFVFGDFSEIQQMAYTWALVPSRQPQDMDLSKIILDAEAEVREKSVWAHTHVELAKDASGSVPGPQTGWQGLLILVGAGASLVLIRRRSKQGALPFTLASLLVVASLLAACSGYFGMWGTLDTTADLTKLEYQGHSGTVVMDQSMAGSDNPDATVPALWKLSGTASTSGDWNVLIGVVDPNGGEEKSVVCTGTLDYEVNVYVMEDVEIRMGGGE
jgi:hypothetical protein